MILCIKTEGAVAEVVLTKDTTDSAIATVEREFGRSMAKELPGWLEEIVNQHGTWQQLSGLVVFEGPGSFTSLRIGITVANTLAYALDIPIVATAGATWRRAGVEQLKSGKNYKIVRPAYGADAHITTPRK